MLNSLFKFYNFILNLTILFQLFLQVINNRGVSNLQEASEDSSPMSSKCTLTGKPSMDPFPSLSKCYKYNNEACCLSVHDEIIKDYISSILSTSCIRKYSQFESIMCLGCHPLERNYLGVDENGTKIIRVCKSFAVSMWNSSSEKGLYDKTEVFDNCGFKTKIFTNNTEKFKYLSGGEKYIIPSQVFDNFTDFFEYIKIPFYEDYKIVIQDETNEHCYDNSYFININYLLFFILIIINFYF